MHGFLSRDGVPPADLLEAARQVARLRRRAPSTTRSSRSSGGFTLPSPEATLSRHDACSSRRAPSTSCPTSRAPVSCGVETFSTVVLPRLGGSRPPIGVLGAGPGSVDHAHLLGSGRTTSSSSRTRIPSWSASGRHWTDGRGIAVVDGIVERLSVVNDAWTRVHLADGRAIPRAAVFIRPALLARKDGLADSLGYDVVRGRIRSGSTQPVQTSVPGVWAVGNPPTHAHR